MKTDQLVNYERVADKKRLDFIYCAVKNKISQKGKVLDIGCGNGIISLHLGGYGFDVTGIDVSEKAIEQAGKNNPYSQVKFKVQSAEDLVASGEVFDVIICSEVLEHLHDPSALIQVLYHLLKPNGRLIVTVPNGYGPREIFVTKPVLNIRRKNNLAWKLITKLKKGMGYKGTTVQSAASNLDHVQFFSRKDLERLSADHSFRIIQFGKANFLEDVFPFSFFTKKIPLLQKVDCKIADWLPYYFTGGFFTVWEKKP